MVFLRLVTQLFLLIFSAASFADESTSPLDKETLRTYWQQELQLHDFIFKVFAPNQDIFIKAQISFHNQLLAVNKKSHYAVMQLSSEDQKRLLQKDFILLPATEWIKNRRQHIESSITTYSKHNNSLVNAKQIEPCYLTVEETYQGARELNQLYADLTQWIDIGNSWQKTMSKGGYDLNVLVITNKNIAEEKPKLFIQSAMHARELAPAQLSYDFASYLLSSYQRNADVTWLIDHREIHILFQANPDARKMAEQNLLWRKNTNENYCGSTSLSRGADLNRNFSMFWNSNTLSSTNSSNDQCSEVFRGSEASSEPETQAIEAYVRKLFPDERGPANTDSPPLDKSGLHLDIHSFGRLLLWPWGHTSVGAPNDAQFKILAQRIAYFNQYISEKSDALYPTDGTSDGVSYGELGVAFLTFELGDQFFEPCINYNSTIKPNNIKALIYASKITAAPYLLPSGPDVSVESFNNTATDVYDLILRADDTHYYSLRFRESPQSITAAEYSIDTPFSNNSISTSLDLVDGNADSSSELFSTQIDSSSLSPGRHTIYLRAQNASGQWGPTTAVFLDKGEISPFVYFKQTCDNTLLCNFDADASFSNTNTLTSYNWDFGDGSSASTSITSHNYSAAGSYIVTLNVSDDNGNSTSVGKTITVGVTSSAPTVSFTLNCQNTSCQFDATGSNDDGEITNYQWDFGDGSLGLGIQASHTYTMTGNLQVSLTLTDDLGLKSSNSQSIKIITDKQATTSPTSDGGGGGAFHILFLLLLTTLKSVYLRQK